MLPQRGSRSTGREFSPLGSRDEPPLLKCRNGLPHDVLNSHRLNRLRIFAIVSPVAGFTDSSSDVFSPEAHQWVPGAATGVDGAQAQSLQDFRDRTSSVAGSKPILEHVL